MSIRRKRSKLMRDLLVRLTAIVQPFDHEYQTDMEMDRYVQCIIIKVCHRTRMSHWHWVVDINLADAELNQMVETRIRIERCFSEETEQLIIDALNQYYTAKNKLIAVQDLTE